MNGLVGIICPGIPMERDVQAMSALFAHQEDEPSMWCKALANGYSLAMCYGSEQRLLVEDDLLLLWNGTLRNCAELKRLLADEGIASEEMSDVALVLEAWYLWGSHCLARLRGEYAFVLLDSRNGGLYLARDTMGIKPLFYTFDGQQFSFCSEIKPLMHCLRQSHYSVDSSLSFLLYGVQLGAQTAISTIQRVQPGYFVKLDRDAQVTTQEVHSLTQLLHQPKTVEKNYSEKIEKNNYSGVLDLILKNYIDKSFQQKKHYSVLLDGSLGADILAGATREVMGSVEAYITIPLLSGKPLPDALMQRHRAQAIAQHLNIPLREIEVEVPIGEDCSQLLSVLDEPLSGQATLSLTIFSQTLKQINASSVLSALGSDVLLANHPAYGWAAWADYFRQAPASVRWLLRWVNAPGLQRILPALHHFHCSVSWSDQESDQAWLQQACDLTSVELKSLLATRKMRSEYDSLQQIQSAHFWQLQSDTVNRWCYMNLLFRVIPGLLPAMQQISAAQEKTICLPFLDEAMIHYALSIPGEAKINSLFSRHHKRSVLGQWAKRYIPTEWIVRTHHSIQFPLRQWLKFEWAHWVQNYILSHQGLSGRNIFCSNTLKRWVLEHRTDQADHSELLWRLLCLEHTLRQCDEGS